MPANRQDGQLLTMLRAVPGARGGRGRCLLNDPAAHGEHSCRRGLGTGRKKGFFSPPFKSGAHSGQPRPVLTAPWAPRVLRH